MLNKQRGINRFRYRYVVLLGYFLQAVLMSIGLAGCGLHSEQLAANPDNVKATQSVNDLSKVRMKSSDKNKVEAVSAVSYDGTHITASVISHGCTRSNHFSLRHEIVNGSCSVTIERTKPDLCRRAPMLAEVKIEWTAPADCAELELVIANPVLVIADDGRLKKNLRSK